jgi:hemolysin-activating ACP:hemolysin acyltransferase
MLCTMKIGSVADLGFSRHVWGYVLWKQVQDNTKEEYLSLPTRTSTAEWNAPTVLEVTGDVWNCP